MALYAKGDVSSFDVLYFRYETRLFHFLNRRLPAKHASAAVDLFQGTWLKVHQARKTFDLDQKFSAWLFTIGLNVLRDHLSLKRHEVEVPSPEDGNQDSSPTQDKSLILKETLGSLDRFISRLDPIQKDILLMSDWEGFETKEIAKILKISDGSVRQHLYRARQLLRESVGEIL